MKVNKTNASNKQWEELREQYPGHDFSSYMDCVNGYDVCIETLAKNKKFVERYMQLRSKNPTEHKMTIWKRVTKELKG